ncbi:hypothetical protein BU26DRAFT_611116 [Trematosphaeria pertusa]|uniref:histidine kinase n=1 Tax=Trematosphaeria pertusa TaxID=390896 RepID=A0A6A6HT55_9PLEO|nr:uncharacterized protein BU26DRAFT_611116 [Trematosphaeria pertusa]KAF2241286.1 hypothetical protein BU26DRAFT_611116 [Trematosphaeria pertusa]
MALEKPLDKATKDILTQSHSASKSLIYVIYDLLHLTGGGRQPTPLLVHAVFDIGKGLQTTLDQLRGYAGQKSLSFGVVKDLEFPQYVYGDLPRLQQAVSTLVQNAVQRTETGGVIVRLGLLSATEKNCVIQVTVQDTGNGMSERRLDDLFEEFEQLPDEDMSQEASPVEERNPVQSECGDLPQLNVGLALLARYIKHSGGQIRGKSVIGRGSTFAIEVPLQIASASAAQSLSRSSTSSSKSGETSRAAAIPGASKHSGISSMETPPALTEFHSHLDPSRRQSEESRPSNLRLYQPSALPEEVLQSQAISRAHHTPPKNRLTILIADDNSVNLSILQRRLNKMGHEVKTSRDGKECFEAFQKHCGEVDMVLMDLNVGQCRPQLIVADSRTQMPLVDGKQATLMIRAFERTERPPDSSPQQRQDRRLPLSQPDERAPYLPQKASSCAAEPLPPRSAELAAPALLPPDLSSLAISHPSQLSGVRPSMSPPLTNANTLDVGRPSEQTSYFPPVEGTPPTSEASSTRPGTTSPLSVTTGSTSHISYLALHNVVAAQGSTTSFVPQAPSPELVPLARTAGHTPIFAVSASLDQHSQESLQAVGFDGWLSQPIDFRRLSLVLEGTANMEFRAQATCVLDDFKNGGWFILPRNSHPKQS